MMPDRKTVALLALDAAAVTATAFGAAVLRSGRTDPVLLTGFSIWLLLDLLVTLAVFHAMGLYRLARRDAGFADLEMIVYAVGARTLLIMPLLVLLLPESRGVGSTVVIQGILLLGAVGGIRRMGSLRAGTVIPASRRLAAAGGHDTAMDVATDGLLGREEVNVEMDVIREALAGRRVLITGGAGSIGRELARQVAGIGPERLVVLDRNENSVYSAEMDLRRRSPTTRIDWVVGDILDRPRLHDVMSDCAPHVVFHAAAYKHVPLMEANPAEAFKNNVFGTRDVAAVAAEIGVERFVLISTDKAVNPTSVMGATKRLAEMVLGTIPGRTRFVSVRFGNVLGSDGSVVPLFREQIARGGPVTVTHPDVSRYFMTITEAVRLVLQAAAMGSGGEVFLLDMGKPVRIVDLARTLIEQSGLRPDEDIRVVYTGLRAGENLSEEPYRRGEEWLETSHRKILRFRDGRGTEGLVATKLETVERTLQSCPPSGVDALVRRALIDLIPEFKGPRPVRRRGPQARRTPARAAPA